MNEKTEINRLSYAYLGRVSFPPVGRPIIWHFLCSRWIVEEGATVRESFAGHLNQECDSFPWPGRIEIRDGCVFPRVNSADVTVDFADDDTLILGVIGERVLAANV
jgi:hypothetical protein